jgi:hypothetical protein
MDRTAVLAVAVVLAAACTEPPTQPAPPPTLHATPRLLQIGASVEGWLGGYPDPSSPAPNGAILAGAGDIAECYQGNPPPIANPPDASQTAAEETAKLLGRFPETATVMAVGDNAYQFGLFTPDYQYCYDPTWGRYKARTRPAAGNHEYMSGGSGYFAYFGPVSNPPLGYYSYNLGSWHVIVLNSTPQVYMCYPPELTEIENEDGEWWRALWPVPQLTNEPTSRTAGRACPGDVAQQAWLVQDLTTHASYQCTAVYFHHPRFSSGSHGNHYQMQRIWDILYAYGADVAVTGHDHNYERFAPQDEKGKHDPSNGIREFVVGTGGADLRSVGPPIENSEVLFTGTHGVLGLALNDGAYGWAFVGVDGTVRDSGSESCHGPPKKRPKLPFRLPT